MGYESKLIIVDISTLEDNGLNWASKIAEIDLCKAGIPSEFFREKAGCFIYADDGNTRIETDRCGDPLTVCSDVPKFITWMKNQQKDEYYRRWPMAIALLESINEGDWANIKVLHYGH